MVGLVRNISQVGLVRNISICVQNPLFDILIAGWGGHSLWLEHVNLHLSSCPVCSLFWFILAEKTGLWPKVNILEANKDLFLEALHAFLCRLSFVLSSSKLCFGPFFRTDSCDLLIEGSPQIVYRSRPFPYTGAAGDYVDLTGDLASDSTAYSFSHHKDRSVSYPNVYQPMP